MDKLSLFEINVKRQNDINLYDEIFGSSPICIGYISNISSKPKYNVEVTDVSDDFMNFDYYFKNKFTLIYLYDYDLDSESRNFLKTFGGKLHNTSSLNITILTYYSSEMVKEWHNVQFRHLLSTNSNKFDSYKIIKRLQKLYDVKKLPALVILKKDSDGKEEKCNVDLSNLDKFQLFSYFNEIIEIINDNCEEDFSVISRKICGTSINCESQIKDINLFDYIGNLVKKKSKTLEEGYTQNDLADELNISVRTLSNKRKNGSFTHDECIYMGFIFELSIRELNELLKMNNHRDLSFDGRDGLIRQCLLNGCNIVDANSKLYENNYETLIK